MEEVVVQRLIGAAEAQGDDPGWSIHVRVAGIRIVYAWEHEGRDYTIESLNTWLHISGAHFNPLLVSMHALTENKRGFDLVNAKN